MMKKLILIVQIMMCSTIFASNGRELTRRECKNLVDRALTLAYVDLRFNDGDGTFPKKISEIVLPARIPTTFTDRHLRECGRGVFNHGDGLNDEISLQVAHGGSSELGSIKITVIRANYDQVKKDYDKSRGIFSGMSLGLSQNSTNKSRKKKASLFWNANTSQQWFDLLQLDH